MSKRARAVRIWVLAGMVAAVGVLGAGWAWDDWRARAELDEALALANGGQHARAYRALGRLGGRFSDRGEVWLALGNSALRLGRVQEAMDAWSRVDRGAREWPEAALLRLRLALESGRLDSVDDIDADALKRRGLVGSAAWNELERLYQTEGRMEELKAMRIERLRDPGTEDLVGVLQSIWQLDYDPFPDAAVAQYLERAAAMAPSDFRVRLARARLHVRHGRFAQARALVEECRRERPHDRAMLRVWLECALEAGEFEEVARTLESLPLEGLDARGWRWVGARLARAADDRVAERSFLMDAVRESSGDMAALDRLVELAIEDGDRREVERLRGEQARIQGDHQRYQEVAGGEAPEGFARELGLLSERLGRREEARAWWQLEARMRPDDREAKEASVRLAVTSGEARDDVRARVRGLLARGFRKGRDARVSSASAAFAFAERHEPGGAPFRFENGPSVLRQLPETMSGGVGLLDFDRDGWLDIYVVQGGVFPPPSDPCNEDVLLRNRGDGTFEDVSEAAGLRALPGGYGHGVAIGDVNNDGWPDVFVTRWGGYGLFVNDGTGGFRDATKEWGLDEVAGWPTSAAFADIEGDGDLDLYVCHYVDWDPANRPDCGDPARGGAYYCDPRRVPAQADRLFRNDGGRFVDVSRVAGIAGRGEDGRGLGVLAADLDGDGRVDFYVANDMTANFLFRNQGNGTFEEAGQRSGVAGNASGAYQAGMGVACGDLDGDGRLDLAVTNFYGESTTFYRNLGEGLFVDATAPSGLAAVTRDRLGFGLAAADLDQDGWADLLSVNGHVNDLSPSFPYAMRMQLLRGGAGGRFVDVSDSAGAAFARERVGRGLAVGDLDNDGRLDAVVVAQREPLAVLRNETAAPGHFLILELEGVGSNRDGVGAWVRVEAGGRSWVVPRVGGGSYQSSGDPRVHVGLGAWARCDVVEIRWPSGLVDRFADVAADAVYRAREGRGELLAVPGFGGILDEQAREAR